VSFPLVMGLYTYSYKLSVYSSTNCSERNQIGMSVLSWIGTVGDCYAVSGIGTNIDDLGVTISSNFWRISQISSIKRMKIDL